jgi:hypothetical protein
MYVCMYVYMVPHIGLIMAHYAVFFLNFIFPFILYFFPPRIGLDDGHYAVFLIFFIFFPAPTHRSDDGVLRRASDTAKDKRQDPAPFFFIRKNKFNAISRPMCGGKYYEKIQIKTFYEKIK